MRSEELLRESQMALFTIDPVKFPKRRFWVCQQRAQVLL